MNQPLPLPWRKTFFAFAFSAAILILSTCEKETPEPRDYPRINGVQITNISNEGATFTADLYSLGTTAINEHGFLWGSSKSLDMEVHERKFLGPLSQTGVFSAEVRTGLSEGKEYYVRPFVKTSARIVYGPVVSFKSLGSIGPVIKGFQPDSAGWGDTLKIYGKNFSWVSNDVFLNDKKIPVYKSCDTVIYASVESSVKSVLNDLSVSTAGIKNTFIPKKFRLIAPSIQDFSPKQVYWGDTLVIKGNQLKYILMSGSYVKLGTLNCLILPASITENTIKIKVPHELSSVSNQLSLNVNGIVLTGASPVTLLPPYFTFTPTESTWGKTITLKGRFNTIANRNSFYFNSQVAGVISTSERTVTLVVPSYLADAQSSIKYNIVPFNVTSNETFTLLPPVISTFSPVEGAGGATVTIRGKYYSTVSTTVKFGNIAATIVSKNDSTIVVKAPSGVSGPVKISVRSFNQETVSTGDFNLKNPNITGFSPSTGTFDDAVTITGEYFTPENLTVSFGNYSAQVVSSTQTEIAVKVPAGLDSIPATLKVTAGGNQAISTDKFTLTPPVISSVSPLSYTPGGDIVISGQFFNPDASRNKVFLDIYELQVKSATANEIITTCPSSLPRGSFRICVQTGGYKRFSASVISVNSAWLRIPAPQIRTNVAGWTYFGIRNYGAGIKNFGYVVSVSMMATYKFNPADQSWLKLEGFPFRNDSYGAGSTVMGDTLYLVGGYTYSANIMHAFDPNSNTWRRLGDFNPRQVGVLLGLGKSLWFGMAFPYGGSSTFWEISSLNKYSYTTKGAFPVTSPATFASYFTTANRGYVILANNQVWQFNPNDLTWTRKNDFPGSARYMATSFVIGNYAYFGLGRNSSSSTQVYDDIWKYDILADTWSLATRIPVRRYSATVFTINNKAYIGFGINTEKELYDFYEYDPAH